MISIQVSEKTAGVISMACESLARQMMGQFDTALDPAWTYTCGGTSDSIFQLRHLLQRACSEFRYDDVIPQGVEMRDISWDVYQTVRQWLAYRRQPDGGFTVDFYDPLVRSGERIGIMDMKGDPDPRPEKARLADELVEILGDDLRLAVEKVKEWKAIAEKHHAHA